MKGLTMKKVAICIFGIGLAAAILFSSRLFAAPNRYGPIDCPACELAYPISDLPTRAFITTYVRKMTQGNMVEGAAFNVFVGDTIVLCNSSSCVDYVKNMSGDWEGVSPRARVRPPRSGGGDGGTRNGGGRGNSGGGYDGGSGGNGSGRGGSVTTGPMKPERPPVDN